MVSSSIPHYMLDYAMSLRRMKTRQNLTLLLHASLHMDQGLVITWLPLPWCIASAATGLWSDKKPFITIGCNHHRWRQALDSISSLFSSYGAECKDIWTWSSSVIQLNLIKN